MYGGLASLSGGCPPDRGRLHTCYSPVRHSPAGGASSSPAAVRLACVKPVASVHPEPGSNSPLLNIYYISFLLVVVDPWLSHLRIGLTESCSLSLLSPLCRGDAACPVAECHCSLRSRFPVCGCKITTLFRSAQVFGSSTLFFYLFLCFKTLFFN